MQRVTTLHKNAKDDLGIILFGRLLGRQDKKLSTRASETETLTFTEEMSGVPASASSPASVALHREMWVVSLSPQTGASLQQTCRRPAVPRQKCGDVRPLERVVVVVVGVAQCRRSFASRVSSAAGAAAAETRFPLATVPPSTRH
jgi:hypothetical protein